MPSKQKWISPAEVERMTKYKQHRERLENIRCEVDNKSPELNTTIAFGNIRKQMRIAAERTFNNCNMIGTIIRKALLGGDIKTFREPINYPVKSNKNVVRKQLLEIEKKNVRLGERIVNAKPVINTGMRKSSKSKRTQFQLTQYLKSTLNKCKIKLNMSPRELALIVRPRIHLDIRIEGISRIERIVMELYLEAAPQIVRDLVVMCKSKSHKRFSIMRLFLDLWMVLELALDGNSLSHKCLEYNEIPSVNMNQVGLLLFAKSNSQGFKNGYLNFIINFRKIRVLREKYICFGRVIKNLSMFNRLQQFATRRGKPTKQLNVVRCAVIS